MPAVKMMPIKNEDGQTVAHYFEPSNSFAAAAQKNRLPMLRPDGKIVGVNRKLQAKGHYDDRHNFTLPTASPSTTVSKEKAK